MDTPLPPPNAAEPERPHRLRVRSAQLQVLRGVAFGMLFEGIAGISGWFLLSSHRLIRSLMSLFERI